MITREKFMSYYHVQMLGDYNMIMDADIVMKITCLTKDEYFDIIKNYKEYRTKFINE